MEKCPLLNYDYLFKILLIGKSGVGKSAIMNRFVDDAFFDSHITTIGVDFKIRTMEIDGKIVKMQIWDTAGQERFRTIVSSYYRGAHAIFLVYDITDPDSFSSLEEWIKEARKFCGENTIISLIGNKTDLEDQRKVNTEDALAFAECHSMAYAETSCKTGSMITEAFTKIAEELRVNKIVGKEDKSRWRLVSPANNAIRDSQAEWCMC
jgi:Ras-related protein Rab-1A